MGVGMQIVCVGFTGYAALEAEAGAQLVRLERFRARLADCRLTIESRTSEWNMNWNLALPSGGAALANAVTLTIELSLVEQA